MERWHIVTGQQYLRARYDDPSTGRFNTLDPFVGNNDDPQSLHKYLYALADPITYVDPSGLISSLFGRADWGDAVAAEIVAIYRIDHPFDDTSRSGRATKIGAGPPRGKLGTL